MTTLQKISSYKKNSAQLKKYIIVPENGSRLTQRLTGPDIERELGPIEIFFAPIDSIVLFCQNKKFWLSFVGFTARINSQNYFANF